MVYGQKQELVFLGRDIGEQRDYSESIAEKIDEEVSFLVNEAYDRARDLINEYRPQLEAIAQELIEIETLDREAFLKIFNEPVQPKNGGTPIPLTFEKEKASSGS